MIGIKKRLTMFRPPKAGSKQTIKQYLENYLSKTENGNSH